MLTFDGLPLLIDHVQALVIREQDIKTMRLTASQVGRIVLVARLSHAKLAYSGYPGTCLSLDATID
jgi:hypothetical protein